MIVIYMVYVLINCFEYRVFACLNGKNKAFDEIQMKITRE